MCCCSDTFPFFLTLHLKAARQCESSFTAENLAKINFLLLFLALARQSKHDRSCSFLSSRPASLSAERVRRVSLFVWTVYGCLLPPFDRVCAYRSSRVTCVAFTVHTQIARCHGGAMHVHARCTVCALKQK